MLSKTLISHGMVLQLCMITPAVWASTCSSYWYGNPDPGDCERVLSTLRAREVPGSSFPWVLGPAMTDAMLDELIELEATSPERDPDFGDPNAERIHLPLIISQPKCTLYVLTSDAEMLTTTPWRFFSDGAQDVHDACVKPSGKGGQKSWFEEEFALVGPGSEADKYYKAKIAPHIDEAANKITIDSFVQDDNPLAPGIDRNKRYTPEVGDCLATRKQDCGKTCYSHDDCDLSADYRCALKGGIDSDLPIDPSWGKFQCTWIPYAASIVAAAATLTSCKGRRCLLQADGSLEYTPVDADGLQQATDVANSSFQAPKVKYPATNVEQLHLDYKLYCPCKGSCTKASAACCAVDNDDGPGITLQTPSNLTKTCDESTGKWTDVGITVSQSTSGGITNSSTVSSKLPAHGNPGTTDNSTSVSTELSAHGDPGMTDISGGHPIPSTTATSTDHPVCQSIGNICTSWWGCGDGDHCQCLQLNTMSLYFHCGAKAGFGPNNNKRDLPEAQISDRVRDRRDDDAINARANIPHRQPTIDSQPCPCNCTYVSEGCCGKPPGGMIWEPPGSNLGMVQLPDDHCCNTGSGEAQPGSHRSSSDMTCI